ncbi:MAG: hypothetical protein COC19_06740 [SAR86 cluster bacterium]|uniref:ABC transporter permease n=1 Tax=SAR86 cluster bacterium TaxID=2030880 RepID=A0A2A4MHT1_9GAMM|nr:MAG: hypothetical protein COC19_06740 [SAR86 cluster bacterium]
MSEAPQLIALSQLLLAFLPVLAVVFILFRWTGEGPDTVYGLGRMLFQLLLIGYFLSFLFEVNNAPTVLIVLSVMVLISSWIALRTVKQQRRAHYGLAALSILIGGGLSLLVVSQLVLQIEPYYSTRHLIPLAGMVFASAMNSVSIAAERFFSETKQGMAYGPARSVALKAALIPITNSLFAVGLVSLPGMMTGQILTGVDPLIAARYQIMVMCMLFSSAGLAAALFLRLLKSKQE